VNHLKKNNPKRYIILKNLLIMTCFCGCETYEKSEDGFKIACVKCQHGAQNHDDEYRESARKNESQSQKRDADFG
jgi:Zn ribbon nucleic-acid-binding protein